MTGALFRREVLDAQRRGWLGGISLSQPLRLWVLTLGAALAAAMVALFLTLGSYTRRSTVVGQLVPKMGLATVLAPATGVVNRIEVIEGQRVVQGQSLAAVVVPRATPTGGDTQVALEQRLKERQEGMLSTLDAQREQLTAQTEGLQKQLATTRQELSQIEVEVATRQDQSRIAQETLSRLRQLEAGQYVSVLQIKQQEATALEYAAQVQTLQRQAIGTRRTIAQLEQALGELPGQLKAVSADFHSSVAQLEQERVENVARGALTVAAPVSGVVATQLIKPGQAVQAGQAILSLLPGDGRLEAELMIPSRAIGFIQPGDRVLLRYQAYPYQKFGHQIGKVERITRSALSGADLGIPLGKAQPGESYYRVTVELAKQSVTAYGQQEQLKPGMGLDADILGEKRRLIEWIFEPLYSLRGKVSTV